MLSCFFQGFSSMLVAQHLERAGDALARRMRHDHLVDIAALGRHERIGEARLIFVDALLDLVGVAELGAIDDLDRALGAHHRDLGRRPGIVDVAADMLRGHNVIGAAIGLAGDDGDLRHRRLGEGEQQLGAMLDQAAIFLRGARQEARHVDEGDDRNVEAVAEAHEARGLARGVAVEHAGQHHRLIGDDADGAAFHAGEAGDDVAGEGLLDLEEIALVHDLLDQLLHVVGLVRIVGDQRVERRLHRGRHGSSRRQLGHA